MQLTIPKITVVTVTYNAERYLEQTIQSIISQDYKNIEYIVIDGGSDDGTVEIIKQYNSYIDYWISESDNGIYDAMNKAIDKATGKWINFMNAGDVFFDKNTISKIISNIDIDSDLIAGDICYIKNDSKEYKVARTHQKAFDGMFCFHQSLFTKVDIMKKYKFDTNFKIAGDYDFVLKCYIKNHKFQYLSFPFANFLYGGISETDSIRARIEDMFIQSKYIDNINDIYKSYTYGIFKSLENNDNNTVFTKLLNNLFEQFEELELSKKRFVLYGYGNVGKIVYSRFKDNIIFVVDKNYSIINQEENIEVFDINKLLDIEYDYILISVLGANNSIENYLEKGFNIAKNKIMKITV